MDLNGFAVAVVDYSAAPALNTRLSHLRLASRISFSRMSTSNCRVVFIVLLILEIESQCGDTNCAWFGIVDRKWNENEAVPPRK